MKSARKAAPVVVARGVLSGDAVLCTVEMILALHLEFFRMLHRLDFTQSTPQVEQVEDLRFSELPFRDGKNALEKNLEDLIAANVGLIDVEEGDETLLIIGRQLRTSSGKVMDLVAMSSTGALTLIEVKRDAKDMKRRKDYAEIQAVRYAASLAQLQTMEDLVVNLYGPYIQKFESVELAERGRRSPEEWARKKLREFLVDNEVPSDRINHAQNIVLVGAAFDADTKSAAAWMAANGVPMRVIEIRPCKVAESYCLDVQQIIPLPSYDDFYVNVQPSGSKEPARSGRRRTGAGRLRVKDILEAGMVNVGDTIYVKDEEDKIATILDHKYCEYRGTRLTISQWAAKMKDWSGMNVYNWVVHAPTGRLLGDFREELEAQSEVEETIEELDLVEITQET